MTLALPLSELNCGSARVIYNNDKTYKTYKKSLMNFNELQFSKLKKIVCNTNVSDSSRCFPSVSCLLESIHFLQQGRGANFRGSVFRCIFMGGGVIL